MSIRAHLLHLAATGVALISVLFFGADWMIGGLTAAFLVIIYVDRLLTTAPSVETPITPQDATAENIQAAIIAAEPPEAGPDYGPALQELAMKLARGDMTARLAAPDPADTRAAKSLNDALQTINTAVDEALALADVASGGDLTARANGRYHGHADALTAALNGLLGGLSELAGALQTAVEQTESRSSRMAQVAADLTSRSRNQLTAFETVQAEFKDICSGLDKVNSGAETSRAAIETTVVAAEAGRERISEAVTAISRVASSSKEIGDVVELIASISQQSQLLSVNASVEAARAGEAGLGFGIVASEMGSLAARTNDAAKKIDNIAKGAARDVAEGAKLVSSAVEAIDRIETGAASAASASANILTATAEETDRLGRCQDTIAGKQRDVAANLELAETARLLADELANNAEALHNLSSRFILDDPKMTDAVKRCADQASQALEAAVDRGEISMEDLFSHEYQRIKGSNPAQYLTPYVPITDRYVSPIIETVFDLGPGIAFGAVMNDDGFLPTHSQKFSKPQGGDPVWNTSNCRNRRFFNDRVGLACGQSRGGHLLQVYRRDMGGGVYVTMKDISAPITVKGKHWGGFRIGYRTVQEDAAPAQARKVS
ncbi:MAG: methyl-accepting chemotaxis protein [Neomegalonema sp.]|nr:methyl-accepting chemotaxis protein [Neomegalonema sp.]